MGPLPLAFNAGCSGLPHPPEKTAPSGAVLIRRQPPRAFAACVRMLGIESRGLFRQVDEDVFLLGVVLKNDLVRFTPDA